MVEQTRFLKLNNAGTLPEEQSDFNSAAHSLKYLMAEGLGKYITYY